MARKNSPADVLDSVETAADAAAKIEQGKRIAKLKPTIRQIYLSQMYSDKSFNVREEESYLKENNEDLYHSLRTFGFDSTKAYMTVSQKPTGLENGESGSKFMYLVLRGNLRFTMMNLINQENKEKGEPPQFTKLDVMAYSDLSADDEILIMADHTGSKPLNRYEQSMMVGRGRLARGVSYKEAGNYFGMGASTAQRLCNIYEMPPALEELRKQCHNDPDALVFGQKEITALYTAYRADFTANGILRDCNGPAFRQAWEVITERLNQPKEVVRKGKTGTEIVAVQDSLKAIGGEVADLACQVLDWTLGQPIQLASTVQNTNDRMRRRILELETETARLYSENKELRDKISILESGQPDVESLQEVVG